MSTCFVIQPFDLGRFDKRYEDTFHPAILAAGLEPYRVDQDPNSAVPIEDIEAGIRRASVCFAEISTDNPNVWFELGFAIAARKPVVLVCGEDRDRFPFDVQHRTIIRYKTESLRDFEEVAQQVTLRLKAALKAQIRAETVEEISPAAPTAGLTEHEVVGLITIAADGLEGHPVTPYTLRQEMGRAGYTDVACTLALRGLQKKGYVERVEGFDGSREYSGFYATEAGLDWLEHNLDQLRLKLPPRDPGAEDELPF